MIFWDPVTSMGIFLFTQKRNIMRSSLGSTLSALNACGGQIRTIAHNVANLHTEGYKKMPSVMVAGRHGDVSIDPHQDPSPGPANPESGRHPLEAKQLSNVELAEEIPQSIISQRGYEANLKMVKTQDEMMGSLMDIIS
jgi:flagellar basal-body rod protein FlgC